MAERDKFPWLKKEFDALATEDGLGDPEGEPSAAYLRVSSAGQAEEGRSGLPRQMEHIHQKALESKLSIPWAYLFFDDHSGFEFEDRPGLQELLAAVKKDPGFSHIVIEYLDRLSRNADWHQGYLIERLQEAGQSLAWWKPYHSRIERAVFGAISQDGMEQAIERMKAGTRKKAESGRVTAKSRAYGYVFVDSQGRGVDDPASQWRKDTHYAIHPEEAAIVRRVFEDLVHNGKSLYEIADDLNREGIKAHQRAKYWHTGTLSPMVRNPLYQGEFYANQRKKEKRWNPEKQKYTLHQIRKPRSEWILVPVPAIVDPELWESAQEVLKINRRRSTRNASQEWLLTGFLRCANCGYRLTSSQTGHRGKGKGRRLAYCCVSRTQPKSVREAIGCDTPTIRASELEPAVWQIITELIYSPDLVIQALKEKYSSEQYAEKAKRLASVEEQLQAKEDELERWNQAYGAGYLDLKEWGEKKLTVAQESNRLKQAAEEIKKELTHKDDLERQTQVVLTELASMRERGLGEDGDLPFKIKRKIIGLLVDDIVVNGQERTFELRGVIRATRSYGQDFELVPMGRNT
ncbi:MAG: recombinase family protein [Anaerolineales bacterium]|nr:MAG: recombinase family protein [Anaerolineales bacterium]